MHLKSATSTLTPAMRMDLAARAPLAAIDAYVHALIATSQADQEWIDQSTSPLGKRAHLEAVRSGRLLGVKHGKRALVRRADLNAYLARSPVRPKRVAPDPIGEAGEGPSASEIDANRANEVAAEILTSLGLRARRR